MLWQMISYVTTKNYINLSTFYSKQWHWPMKELASVVDKEKLVNVVANYEFLYNRDDKKLQEQEESIGGMVRNSQQRGISGIQAYRPIGDLCIQTTCTSVV